MIEQGKSVTYWMIIDGMRFEFESDTQMLWIYKAKDLLASVDFKEIDAGQFLSWFAMVLKGE